MLGLCRVIFWKKMPKYSTTGVRSGGECCDPPQLEKNSKYTKTENNLTADHELLPKQQNTTDYRINTHAVTSQ